jgi:hypothetical protein
LYHVSALVRMGLSALVRGPDFDAKVVAAAIVVAAVFVAAAVVLADAVVQVLTMGLGTFLGLF